MIIDEAISHEERNVEINKLIGEVSDCEPTNAIDYHRQLVEWLKELKQLREQEPVLDKIKRDIFNACSDSYHMPVHVLSCDEIFEIIDKYKAESEDKE